MIRIAIAEDNDFLAQALIEKLSFFSDIKLKYRAEDGNQLLHQLKDDSNIDVVLMDIQMPNLNGILTTEAVKKSYPHIKIIMVTVFDDEVQIFKAIQAGADGYLLKDESAGKVYESVLDILNGGGPMSASIALKAIKLLRQPITQPAIPTKDYALTKREYEVLIQLSTGLNHNEISNNLNISSGTVRKHIENIYKKLHVHNKTEAIQLAQKERLIS